MDKLNFHKEPFKTRSCVFCEQGLATLSIECQEFEYGHGENPTILFANVPVWTCPECDLQFADENAELIQHNAVCDHLDRLRPEDIRAIRDRHHLTQEQFADLTGIGVASIRRWECGNLI